MQKIARPRRYVSPLKLYAMLPALRYSYERGAYVLRFVGETHGPVLRKDRRRGRLSYSGPERRLATDAPAVDPALASRPTGGVRIVAKTPATDAPRPSKAPTGSTAATGSNAATGSSRPEATRRRPQHGRQRPPRPRH
jgi:nucleoid-associated protein YgaU